MHLRQLAEADVEFRIRCQPEEIPFVGNCCCIDDATDQRTEEWIRDQLERGNDWAWCQVTVTASWNGLEGHAYLGGCSYRSHEEFCLEGGYYLDLKAEALADLNSEIERLRTLITELELEIEIVDQPILINERT